MANQKREHAAAIHGFFAHKEKVPTMGGVLIVASVLISALLWGNLTNTYVWVLILVTFWFALVGFTDDWLKLRTQTSRGLSSRLKFLGQLVMGILIGSYLYAQPDFSKYLYLPFIKPPVLFMGVFFIPFIVLVIVGSSNAMNLTDGLDGLAIGCMLFCTAALGVIAYVVGRIDYSTYLQIPYVAGAGELAVFCGAIAGASAGFLWYNSFPAEVMMGDTGSLSLGGAMGTIAVILKKEAVLVIIGGVFVWEALSVILQVASFKMFKRRIFLMSPFHHHLQLKGWPESKVTVRLWIIAMILALVGLSTLKVR